MKKWLAGVAALGAVSYPLVVYFGLSRFQPRYLALLLGLLVLLKVVAGNAAGKNSATAATTTSARYSQAAALVVLALAIYAALSNQAFSLKLYPVVVNVSLLLAFGWSLLRPPSVIERIARISEPQLPAAGVRYTRKITLAWCIFFLGNGLAALYTALYTSFATWALYNGLIAYVLMGCLLGGELLYRHTHMNKKERQPPT